MSKNKDKAYNEIDKIADKNDIYYVTIPDDTIEMLSEVNGVKLTEDKLNKIKEIAVELVLSTLDTVIEDAFFDVYSDLDRDEEKEYNDEDTNY